MSDESSDALTALRYMSEGYDNHFNAGVPLMALHVAEIEKRIAELEDALAEANAKYRAAVECSQDERDRAIAAEAEAAERDRMLEIMVSMLDQGQGYGKAPWRTKEEMLADLRARAEKP